MTLGEYIKRMRAEKSLFEGKSISRSEMARRVGITPQYASDIENDITIPTEDKLEKLVEVLDADEKTMFKLANKLPLRYLEIAKQEYFGEE